MPRLTLSIPLPTVEKTDRKLLAYSAKMFILYVAFPYLIYLLFALNDPSQLEPKFSVWVYAMIAFAFNTMTLAIPICWVWKKFDKRSFDKWPASFVTCHVLCYVNSAAILLWDVNG
jgi:hypothetical protein